MESKPSSSQKENKQRRGIDWENVKPPSIDHEDALDKEIVDEMWNSLYREIGKASADEEAKAAVRLAVYAYAVINGTSREGAYAGRVKVSDGSKFDAALIPRVTGKTRIRRFFRGCMEESYVALKASRVIEDDARYVAQVSELGISPENAFATADWFKDCPVFTPAEKLAYDMSANKGKTRAALSRGKTLEEIETDRVVNSLNTQGMHRGSDADGVF